jgi:hypothetical protein
MKTYPLVYVTWEDAYSTDDWTELADLSEENHLCASTGYLVRKSKDVLVVAGTVSADGQACCVIHIPRRMVKAVERLRGGQNEGK